MCLLRRNVMTQRAVFFFAELEQVFDDFPKYLMNNLVGDFIAKLGEGIF
jgi:hypothetical protein